MSSEKETYRADKLLDHDYDGIQEFDNRLPNWWLWTLWGSIVFALGYWLVFHTYGLRDLPVPKYEKTMAESNALLADSSARGITEEALVAMSQDPAKLAEGQAIWRQYCVVCHKETGEGLVGPNLTDSYWLHGNSALAIHNTIVQGVVEKGMAAWGQQLGPERTDAVVAWVLTLRDTNVEGKAPQGDFYPPAAESGAAPDPSASETGKSTETAKGEETAEG